MISASSLLFSQDQLAITGTAQTVLFSLMLDEYHISICKQGVAINGSVFIRYSKWVRIKCAG
jgi:hypothetical protein